MLTYPSRFHRCRVVVLENYNELFFLLMAAEIGAVLLAAVSAGGFLGCCGATVGLNLACFGSAEGVRDLNGN
jgi:hypothetical protein